MCKVGKPQGSAGTLLQQQLTLVHYPMQGLLRCGGLWYSTVNDTQETRIPKENRIYYLQAPERKPQPASQGQQEVGWDKGSTRGGKQKEGNCGPEYLLRSRILAK